MTPSVQTETQASRAGTGGRRAPSIDRPTEDVVVKLLVSELDPFKVTKARVNPFPWAACGS